MIWFIVKKQVYKVLYTGHVLINGEVWRVSKNLGLVWWRRRAGAVANSPASRDPPSLQQLCPSCCYYRTLAFHLLSFNQGSGGYLACYGGSLVAVFGGFLAAVMVVLWSHFKVVLFLVAVMYFVLLYWWLLFPGQLWLFSGLRCDHCPVATVGTAVLWSFAIMIVIMYTLVSVRYKCITYVWFSYITVTLFFLEILSP